MRFVVLQPGARLHYAVPAVLARRGMLERLYTDAYAPAALARWIGALPPWLVPRPLARLAGRRLPPELAGRVASAPIAAAADGLARALRARGVPLPWPGVEERLRRRIARRAFDGAEGLYTLSNADLDLVRAAKARGLVVVHEQVIAPSVGRILREERRRFPGIEPQDAVEEIEGGIARDLEQWRLADLVLAPSAFVREDVLAQGLAPGRVALVPYGVGEDWFAGEPRPVPGRVLFVGSVGLRKGVHHLAAAARLLRERGVPHEVRVVGPVRPEVLARPEFAGPSYVGPIPRARIRDEFLSADVFVLPTLAEGCALVHLEALACGLPVVTTPNCGSVVRDGVEGYLVPIRDARALADRIQGLLEDRALRDRMSRCARERARDHTWTRFEERMVAALDSIPRP